MSIRDPHLTTFKGALVKLQQYQRPVRDGHPDLQLFCESLEAILRQGLKRGYSLFGLYKRDYWNWIETLEPYIPNNKPCPLYSIAVDACKSCAKIKTSQGRGRMFIRIALNKKFLSTAIEALIKDEQLLQYWYDCQLSILGNELLVESFSSLLLLLKDIKFELNFKNTSFLDETWRLPIVKQYQLVPSKDLGVKVSYVKNRAIVTDIDPGGLGADEQKIEIGDVLDELYGESLLGAQRGKISRLLAIHEGYPIYITVIKCRLKSGGIFYPLREMYQVIHKNSPNFVIPQDQDPSDRGSEASTDDLENMQSISGSAFYRVKYIGKVFTGERGGTTVIENSVKKVLDDPSLQHDSKDEDYVMELAETNVITRNPHTKSLLFKHCFPEIASCGRRLDNMEYFAYVAGYVFYKHQ
ncbi:hypothetical protein BSL78_12510 [Apostichopus japonicus]|uniref:RUN domain-containing protein n=1 Tax=Stichopus japonicus TaxID=307972 RepID=A0A2G8KRH3_STIJA|nr:hypothetical protein BSL78_12510 [Apostichopus japonicus]